MIPTSTHERTHQRQSARRPQVVAVSQDGPKNKRKREDEDDVVPPRWNQWGKAGKDGKGKDGKGKALGKGRDVSDLSSLGRRRSAVGESIL